MHLSAVDFYIQQDFEKIPFFGIFIHFHILQKENKRISHGIIFLNANVLVLLVILGLNKNWAQNLM